jgi:hypothetical protein
MSWQDNPNVTAEQRHFSYRIEDGGNGYVVLINGKPWPEGFPTYQAAEFGLRDLQSRIAEHMALLERNRKIVDFLK